MIRSNKLCFGVLSVFFTIFGLLFVGSSDVNAKKFSVDAIPLYYPNSATSDPNFYSNYQTFAIDVSNDIDTSKLRSQTILNMYSDNSQCSYRSHIKQPYTTTNNDESILYLHYGFAGFNSHLSISSDFDPCTSTDSLSNVIDSSFPLLPTGLKDSLPYRMTYDSFYRTSTGDISGDGIDVSTKFDFLQLFGSGANHDNNVPSTIHFVSIPFGVPNSDVVDTISSGTPISFSGEFIIDLEDPANFGGFSDIDIDLHQQVTAFDGTISYDSISCNVSYIRDDITDPLSVWSVKYQCDTNILTIPDNDFSSYLPYFYLTVAFDYSSSTGNKFNMFIYDSSVSITNNDTTPGGVWGFAPSGSDVDSAPGSVFLSDVSNSETDFFGSLTGLFNFSFVNPFAPIFQMFTDNSSCASIPTIAGMINSNETQVCPWFNSTVRSVVTPVLTLSSMMLIFGFAVRWLGSRSGNFIEDSEGVDSGRFHFGRRGK